LLETATGPNALASRLARLGAKRVGSLMDAHTFSDAQVNLPQLRIGENVSSSLLVPH
jgi:hypothetical protein